MIVDVAIVGAGLVGSSLAIALSRLGLCVLLIDQQASPPSQDRRLFALNTASVAYLNHLGIWPRLQHEATPIQEVRVSMRGRFGMVRLSAPELNMPQLGAMVPAKYLEQQLHETVSQLHTVKCLRPAVLEGLTFDDEGVELAVLHQDALVSMRARVVIGADGARSSVRRLLGIAEVVTNLDEIALVGVVQLAKSHENVAYERLHAPGVLAMLPLSHHQTAMIWSLQAEQAKAFLEAPQSDFLRALQQAMDGRLGTISGLATPLASYPLEQIIANRLHTDHAMLIGNAAHTLYPLAAQGFNLALYEVAMLAECIDDAMQHGSWPNIDFSAIAARLLPQQEASITASSRLAACLQDASLFRAFILQGGFFLMESLPWIKNKFVHHMLSQAAYVPRAMRVR